MVCGEVYLIGSHRGARIDDVKVDTSWRKGKSRSMLFFPTTRTRPTSHARISENGRSVAEFKSVAFGAGSEGRPLHCCEVETEKLWDIHTPPRTNMKLFCCWLMIGKSRGRQPSIAFRVP